MGFWLVYPLAWCSPHCCLPSSARGADQEHCRTDQIVAGIEDAVAGKVDELHDDRGERHDA